MEKIGEKITIEKNSSEEQITEGLLPGYPEKTIAELLPEGITENKIIPYHQEGWRWRLKSEYIKDPKKQAEFKKEEEDLDW